MCGVCRDRDGGWEVGCGLWVVGAITGRSSINRGQRSAVSKLTSMCRVGVLPSRDLWKSTIVNFQIGRYSKRRSSVIKLTSMFRLCVFPSGGLLELNYRRFGGSVFFQAAVFYDAIIVKLRGM